MQFWELLAGKLRIGLLYGIGKREQDSEQTIRSGPGHSGSSHPQDPCPGTDARFRCQSAAEPGLQRHAASKRRLSLPSPPQDRTERLDQGGMENQRTRSACEILLA